MRSAIETAPDPQILVRPASTCDLDTLLALEHHVFTHDRLSRRSLRNFLTSRHASLIVAEADGRIGGYALILFRPGSLIARLYSILVAPGIDRRGLGRRLLAAAEDAALARDCILMRLEVDERNTRALSLYRQAGYRQIGRQPGYYEDGGTALRLEKGLKPAVHTMPAAPPYFHQTSEFTCGPACVLMALAWAGHAVRMGAALEFKLWREATTMFSGSGPGGCEPFGLAVTLTRHGLSTEIFVSHPGPYFLAGVRSEERRRVMRLTQDEFRREAAELHIPIHLTPLSESALMQSLQSDAAAIVLVSGYRMLPRKVPHWVFAYGRANSHVLVHDPDGGQAEDHAAGQSLAVPLQAFARWSRFGPDHLRAAILIRKGPSQ